MPPTAASIVIPTYNEVGNILPLFERIQRSMEPLGAPFEVIIVDDDSPDGTWEAASALKDTYPVSVIRRRGRRGLATAVLEGVDAAAHDIIVVMDADLQHPPEKIPALIACVASGTDIAIGSRFVEQGAANEFGMARRLASSSAALFAQTMFRQLRTVKDIESGFFAFKRDIITGATLHPVGYKILLELLVQARYSSVTELGYAFQRRESGSSKLNAQNMLDYVHHVVSLFHRSGELRRFVEFAAVGMVGAVLNLGVLYVLTQRGMFYGVAGLIAIEVNLVANFTLNRSWTYKDRSGRGAKYFIKALAKDHAVRASGIVLNLAILLVLTSLFNVYYLLSQLVGLGVLMLWNYSGNQWWTWEGTP